MSDDKPKFVQYTWGWTNKNYDSITVYESMNGRVTVADLLEHLREAAPDAPVDDVHINGSINWRQPPSEEQTAKLVEHQCKSDERHEKWERDMWEKLKAKYGE